MITIEIHDVEDFMALCEILHRIREGYFGGE
jgi:predicted DNA-binding protein